MNLLIIFCLLLVSLCDAKANTLNIAKGKISLIDLGSLISAEPILSNKEIARLYQLSALEDENHKNILAVQGIKEFGESDLSIKTSSGIYQFHLNSGKDSGDLILDPNNSKLINHPQTIELMPNRSSLVRLSQPINEYVLCGNPDLLELKQVVDYYDPDFLKVFLLSTKALEGETDLVIATAANLHKLKIKINQKAKHDETINLI
jgi:hypothetical protein